MVQKDFLLDFDLYICERFGYRNSLHVTPTMNGCCIGVNIKPVKLYIRFWEYSNGVGGFPDWCIILVHCNFAKRQEEELQELVRFFKEYAPRYGYKHIGIENNQRLNEVLMLLQMRSAKEDNHVIALTDITI
ncbi:hypothetical protein [Bacteroides caecimuris]|uniref:Uncharacterized protein n=1 Tax=Bacteroides caecimuris TaxID=1796613 RepID=A0A1C7GZQ3_9BACE|nr:hypothetical protein [Bacteroides caecimuris]ANU57062.1 hypothetical protein A4V03_05350 [Bacteroides caecimuris]OXE64855.1 hypothetical protein ADH74_10945 [Bacteroides caecimuris]QQR18074.1 hypothetical protein I5Q79_03820 [Bacteroides caecimuris]UQA31076.1 hypothetical protein M2854_03860 [Bacteroides caecimuris]